MHASKTAEIIDADASRDRSTDASVLTAGPEVELLYHADPRRIGERTVGWPADADGVLTIGRRSPAFVDAHGASRAIEDRFVSRAQVLLRDAPGRGGFEVGAAPDARQPVSLVPLDGGPSEPITAWRRVPDGAVLAVGRCLLLRVGRAPRRSAAGDLGLVGESPALWALRARIEAVARFRESALILGETGTGKELVARALHERGGGGGPFVALNMGGLDAGTASSELFGHVRGAFTGAHESREGAFGAARGGTLFLDEIGDLSPEVQKKLLRVLEDRRYTPVGGRDERPLECRVLAATHAPLSDDVEAGGFRRDLYERLRALTLAVPPLRQRREDVPRLFVRFLSELSARHPDFAPLWSGPDERGLGRLPLDVVLDLMRRPWPGNVRALRNLATATAAASLALGRFTPGDGATPTTVEAAPPRRPPAEVAVPTTEAMTAALAACQGNVRAAAERLGCSRHQLYRWMTARGLDPRTFRGDDDDRA